MTSRLPIVLLTVLLMTSGTASAQIQVATPAGWPMANTSDWTITDSHYVAVDGTPMAVSPDGRWLAGTGPDGDEACVWDVETMSATCDDVEQAFQPHFGNGQLAWAPDSSAFAFTTSDLARVVSGNVYVFDVERGDATNLTNLDAEDMKDAPIMIGASWTSDSEDIMFSMLNGLGANSPAPEIGRVNRSGGDVEAIALPGDWTGAENLISPPQVDADGNLYIAINSDNDNAGIWRIGPDGSSPEQLVHANADPGIDMPIVTSASSNGRYMSIISLTGFARSETENTFFLLDTDSGELTSLDDPQSIAMVAFSPDNQTGLTELSIDGDLRLHTIDVASGEAAPIANSPKMDPWLQYLPTWSEDDAVFLPGGDGGVLLTLEKTN